MLNFGFSEAKLYIGSETVLKETPQAREQVRAMKALGPNVCPRIIKSCKDYYVMEKLKQPSVPQLFHENSIRIVHRLLREKVHPNPAITSNPQWKESLREFLLRYEQHAVLELLDALYRGKPSITCLIHGDPTLANIMLRGKQVILIDPVMPRGKIPSLKEVDHGKMLQSALGWEGAQQRIPYKAGHLIEVVLAEVECPVRTWFWAMIHIIRLFPRARKRPDIVEWGNQQIVYCLGRLYEYTDHRSGGGRE